MDWLGSVAIIVVAYIFGTQFMRLCFWIAAGIGSAVGALVKPPSPLMLLALLRAWGWLVGRISYLVTLAAVTGSLFNWAIVGWLNSAAWGTFYAALSLNFLSGLGKAIVDAHRVVIIRESGFTEGQLLLGNYMSDSDAEVLSSQIKILKISGAMPDIVTITELEPEIEAAIERRDIRAAVDLLEECVRLGDDSPLTYYRLADCYRAGGQTNRAGEFADAAARGNKERRRAEKLAQHSA